MRRLLPLAGLLAIIGVAPACKQERERMQQRQGRAPSGQLSSSDQVKQAQEQSKKSLDDAAKAQREAQKQQEQATQAEKDLKQKQEDLAKAQQNAQRERQEAVAAQQGAQEHTQQAQQQAAQTQQQAVTAQQQQAQESQQAAQQAAQQQVQANAQPGAQPPGSTPQNVAVTQPGATQTIDGKLTSVAANQVSLQQSQASAPFAIKLDANTQVLLDGKPAQLNQLPQGADVRASYQVGQDQQPLATKLEATTPQNK